MPCKKFISTMLLPVALLFEASHSSAAGIAMHGEFSEAQNDGSPCDLVFADLSYSIEFHLLNNPRAAVIYFPQAADGHKGFFTKKTMVGSRGYDDLLFQDKFISEEAPGVSFQITARGLYSSDLILLDFSVTASPQTPSSNLSATPICKASARLFARTG
jgi:hypothetical protein